MHYTSLKKIPGILALVDFEKAFDTVEWSFLFNAFVKFNFGEHFIKWIKLLYTNISSCVSNNGYISNFFTLSRGIRQGYPISALLFILVAEILAINIRCDINIKGITVDGKAFKIGQLADDTTLFLLDVESLRQAINKFNNFGTLSGLKINLDKTEIVSLSDCKIDSVQLTGLLEGIKVATGPFKTLGVWFTCDNEISVKLNYNERIKSMQQTLHIWRARSLSWKGKITILKTLVIPQVIHLFSNIYTPMHILERIDSLFFDFLWGGKPPRVKKSTIINDYYEGGLKMPNIYNIHISQKVIWLKRLTNDNNKKWKALSWALLGIEKDLLDFKLPEQNYKVAKTKFYQQLLDCWFSVKTRPPTSTEDILREYILYNQYIKIGGSCLTISVINDSREHLKTQLVDVLDNTGNFLKLEDVQQKLPLRLTQLEYFGLQKAIEKEWQNKIKLHKFEQSGHLDDGPYLTVNKVLKPLQKLTSQHIYWELINPKSKPPSSLDIWVDLFRFLDKLDWSNIFTLVNRVTCETYLQTFQYKVLNRTLNCRYNLYK